MDTTPGLPPDASGQTPVRGLLAIANLVTDAGTQVRSEISDYIVREYAEALGDGATFPPVVVFRADGVDVLADGFHRVCAYQQAGRDEIDADVYEGGPAEALWFALGANRAHGQRLSEGDKRRAIEMAYQAWPDLSQTRIAAHVGCGQQYVGKVRRQLTPRRKLPDRVLGKDGRRRPATRPRKRSELDSPQDAMAPPGADERADSESDQGSSEASDAQTCAAAVLEPEETPSEALDPAPVDPGRQPESSAEPPTGQREGSATGVTARQSARDRSNRIVSVVADNAKNLTAQEDLIDFTALDREQLPQWIEDLEDARRLLGRFIRRLREEV